MPIVLQLFNGGEQFDPNASMDFWSSKTGFQPNGPSWFQAEEAAEAILEDVFSTPFSLGDRAHGDSVLGERWRDFFEAPNSKKSTAK